MRPTDSQSAAYTLLIDEGANLFAEGKFEAALVSFWSAFRLRPGAPVLLFNLARTMEELSDPRTEDFYTAAVSQGSRDASYQLALRCLASGRRDEAVEHLQAYLHGNLTEDECTRWARQALGRMAVPGKLMLVWRNPENPKKIVKKISRKSSQKEVRFGIL